MRLACRLLRGALLIGSVAVALVGAAGGHSATAQEPSPTSAVVEAVVAVERAVVFPAPDRNAEPLTYAYERERFPVLGRTSNSAYLLIQVEDRQGWILRAQVDVTGNLPDVPVMTTSGPTPTRTAAPTRPASPTPTTTAATPARTPLPTRTPTPDQPANAGEGTPVAGDLPPVVPGDPPPVQITLPDAWKSLNLEVPFRSFDNRVRSIPLTIYFGPLARDAQGFIYLYWGFPNVVDFDGEFNLWADGVQLLRGSLIGDTCNLGIDEQMTFEVGGREGVGTYYAAVACEDEPDATGWFVVLRVNEGSYAFFVAVEPFDALSDYRHALQAILDTVIFAPPTG